jgi:FkbM family methyltransferase
MIEHHGILVHVDQEGDRFEDSDVEFTGWVVADKPINAVLLPKAGNKRLTTCDRPDVRSVFPTRTALGFVGKCNGRHIEPTGLKLAVQVGDDDFEIEYPLPPPLPRRPVRERVVSALKLRWLAFHERLTTNPSRRWNFMLRRHLIYREQRSGIFRRPHTDALLRDFATAVPDAVFIQIGANDGFTGDPLHQLINRPDTRWRGVLVEPVAQLFGELSSRHAHNPRLSLERAAIGETDGMTVIHRLQTTPEDSLWFQQLASLDLDLVLRNRQQLGAADKATVAESVPCLRVATLLERHRIKCLDFLVIDTEGFDWRILRQFDLKLLRPKLILYEHQHLSTEERAETHQFLTRHEYKWAETPEGDTLAWKIPR